MTKAEYIEVAGEAGIDELHSVRMWEMSDGKFEAVNMANCRREVLVDFMRQTLDQFPQMAHSDN